MTLFGVGRFYPIESVTFLLNLMFLPDPEGLGKFAIEDSPGGVITLSLFDT